MDVAQKLWQELVATRPALAESTARRMTWQSAKKCGVLITDVTLFLAFRVF